MTRPFTSTGTGTGTPGLLLDLINDPADPGYAAAAARRGGAPAKSWYDGALAIAGAGLIGLILVTAYLHAHRSEPQTAKLHADLVARVRAAQTVNDALARQISDEDARVTALRDEVLPQSSQAQDAVRRSEIVAGAIAVAGPGLQVRLAVAAAPTASRAPRAGVTSVTDASPLTDKDVRAVVNELWADGAEAISVNDVRLTPLSAIRFAGEAVLVDFQPITSPYVIRAIGDPDMLVTSFADSAVASRYHTRAQLGGITFDWSQPSKLTLPAGSPAQLDYASGVPTSGQPTPGSGAPPSGPVPASAAATTGGPR